jgi:hypothetical protein
MSKFADFDLDQSIERAWSRFQARLADHIADMNDDDILVVEVESSLDHDCEGSAPYVQFCAWGGDLVRSEVSSNAYLAPEHQLKPAAVRMLTAVGWSVPTADRDDQSSDGPANFYLDIERSHADRLAVMTTRALRDVFGVAHPAFLTADDLAEDTGANLGVPTGPASSAEPLVVEHQPVTVHPRDREHLRALVQEALTPVFGQPPEHDEVGDVSVATRRALIFVRVLPDVPAIRLFASVAQDVTDTARAAFEVLRLNRDVSVLQFVLVDDRVMAYVHVPANPFASERLLSTLATMVEVLDDLDHDLVTRIGGRRPFGSTRVGEPHVENTAGAEEVADEPLDPAMLALCQMEADSPGSVTPEVAATVCGDDRDLILELISWNRAEETAWRWARDDALLRGDTDKAEVSDQESRRAETMVNLLRAALRLLGEPQKGREPHREDIPRRGAPGHLRSQRDPAGLEGLDEEPGLWD